jgi:hypothetical protein
MHRIELFRVGEFARRVALALFVVAVIGQVGMGYPTPSAVPQRWQLEFEPGHLRLYVDPIDGQGFWYFTYRVENNTGRDQIWVPSFDMFTDEGEIIPAGDEVPQRVTSAIRDMLGNELLETQREALGDILQGEEHAKDGLVIWRMGNPRVNEFSVFIGGISGETARVVNPLTAEEIILRKTLQRSYLVRGDAMSRGSEPAELRSERWVLR